MRVVVTSIITDVATRFDVKRFEDAILDDVPVDREPMGENIAVVVDLSRAKSGLELIPVASPEISAHVVEKGEGLVAVRPFAYLFFGRVRQACE